MYVYETRLYDRDMKTLLKILLLTPMAFSISSCKNKKADPIPVDVVLISGQSNGVGCTASKYIKDTLGEDKYNEYMSGYPEIQIAFDSWTKDYEANPPIFYSQNKSKDDDFMKVMLGQGNSLASFGPEIGIAEQLHEKYNGKLFLIKFACGASNLKDDWLQRKSAMYRRLINYVKKQMENLTSKGYIPTIKAMCWMQGEGDSYDGYYQEYYDNTKSFVSNLREDLKELSGNKDFSFIDAGINNSSMWQYYAEVNEAKKKFADESDNNVYIDTIAAGLHTNKESNYGDQDAHYDSDSQVKLGNLFAEQIDKFLSK